ncbi:hypothetical protein [Mesorhizobium sp.]|uniref:hypothetical protein n=2 Tax=Mesorhizobium sp. TaxID=1871066 RepID=UPI0025802985|nr:hypothetical protein [Mesorhizobium sp.]
MPEIPHIDRLRTDRADVKMVAFVLARIANTRVAGRPSACLAAGLSRGKMITTQWNFARAQWFGGQSEKSGMF